jgi:hypothetical protein
MDFLALLFDPERFLLFTPVVYRSMLAAYNRESFLVIAAASLALVALAFILLRGRAIPAVAVYPVLAALWTWLALAFHAGHYASINWAADRFAIVAAIQAAMLAIYSLWKSPRRRLTREEPCGALGIGWILLVTVFPLAEMVSGVSPAQLRYAAVTPDTLAWTTFAVVLSTDRRPWLWCVPAAGLAVVDAATAMLLGDVAAITAWLIFAATLFAVPWCARRG